MTTTAAERVGSAEAAVMARLLKGFSLEIMPRDKKAIPALQENVQVGTEVFVAFAQGETPERVTETAAKLVEAGYRPTPHVVGRNLTSEGQLRDYLKGLKQAGATRVLVLGGDADKPHGPFTSGLDVLKTGAVADAGFREISLGGYPEEHPKASTEVLDRALQDKLAEAERQGLQARIITQLCFEAPPIVRYAEKVRSWGVKTPIRVGLAGPADPAALMKFALMCGVGNSVKALGTRGGMISKLATRGEPDPILAEVGKAAEAHPELGVAGVHLFIFAGVTRAGQWAKRILEGRAD